MQFVAVSKSTIRAYLEQYFRSKNKPAGPSTNIRKKYNYSPKAWKAVANAINKQPWLPFGAYIQPRNMKHYKSIDNLADAIWSARKKYAVVASTGVPIHGGTNIVALLTDATELDPSVITT